MTTLPDKTARNHRGFSLIEATIALAILAVMVLSFMGTLNTGFATLSDAIHRSTEGRIVDRILRELQQEDWDQLDQKFSSAASRTFYFDGQGNSVEPSHPNYVYTARAFLDGGGSDELELPGDQVSRVTRNPFVRGVIIRVTSLPSREALALLEKNDESAAYRQISGTIVNLGKENPEPKGSGPK